MRHVFKYSVWFLMKKQVFGVYQKRIFFYVKDKRKKADLENKTMNQGNSKTMKVPMPKHRNISSCIFWVFWQPKRKILIRTITLSGIISCYWSRYFLGMFYMTKWKMETNPKQSKAYKNILNAIPPALITICINTTKIIALCNLFICCWKPT